MKVLVIGAGSWGTAVALHLAREGHIVNLWSHNSAHVSVMKKVHSNQAYLPNHLFPPQLTPTNDLHSTADEILIAVPSHAFHAILQQLPKSITGLAWITKGMDPITNNFLSDLVAHRHGQQFPMAVISGPSFAKEVAEGLPTALTIAGNSLNFNQTWQTLLHHHHLRAYLSSDLIGVQLCATMKNILAIACGLSDGLRYGANARAALITRGLEEMTRLGLKLGAQKETFHELAGMGDLILTCTDNQSRNRRFGFYLGSGLSILDAEKKVGQVVEGKSNAAQIDALAKRMHIELPICSEVFAVLQKQKSLQEAAKTLLNRPLKRN
jgi:glycerol-3-phosphate dehydrogenase (NAD(P)+)